VLDAVRKSTLPIDACEIPLGAIDERMNQLAQAGVRRIAVAGGDGTIGTAAGIASKLSIELAMIPGGTLNHLADDLGIPKEPDRALNLAVRGAARSVDAGSVNEQLFLNTSSVGTYVTFVRIRDRLERRLGYHLASFVAAFRLLLRPYAFTVEVEVEDKLRSNITPLVFVGVGERELKLPTLGGRARAGRRGLHLMIVRGRSRARVAALAFAAAARGTRFAARSPSLEAHVVQQFTIRLRRPRAIVATDGELHTMTAPLRYRWIPDAVRIVAPEDLEHPEHHEHF
jgi:diacylglycerol kinase family enzyme